jgi:hypothetical protein
MRDAARVVLDVSRREEWQKALLDLLEEFAVPNLRQSIGI